APLTLIDRSTGEAITPVVCDLDSGEPLDPRRIRWELEAATGASGKEKSPADAKPDGR
ncbi:UNVERIFIED_CONTAM: hypothetical protein IGO34_28160, partial [Salmonella enterica subsp. enterica serovar Weltevreden]